MWHYTVYYETGAWNEVKREINLYLWRAHESGGTSMVYVSDKITPLLLLTVWLRLRKWYSLNRLIPTHALFRLYTAHPMCDSMNVLLVASKSPQWSIPQQRVVISLREFRMQWGIGTTSLCASVRLHQELYQTPLPSSFQNVLDANKIDIGDLWSISTVNFPLSNKNSRKDLTLER